MERYTTPALSVYERAVNNDEGCKGCNYTAMYNLANLLAEGASGVEQNSVRAVSLYKNAIYNGLHFGAMFNLANVFAKGTRGVKQDVARAESSYGSAIDEGSSHIMIHPLANLLG